MKRNIIKIASILALVFISFSCKNKDEKFTGYIVAKTYINEHYDNQEPKITNYAWVIIMPVNVHSETKAKLISEQWIWHIANKDKIIRKSVTKRLFFTKKLGDKVTVNKY
jgi:hypothetical protein